MKDKLMSVAEAKEKYGDDLILLKLRSKDPYGLNEKDCLNCGRLFKSCEVVAVKVGKFNSSVYMVERGVKDE